MNEKRLPPRLMVLLVVLKGEKVYKVQDIEEMRKGLLISLKSQELSEVLATKLKQAIHEIFENEKKKGGLMYKEPSLEPMESSIIKEALYLLTPQLP